MNYRNLTGHDLVMNLTNGAHVHLSADAIPAATVPVKTRTKRSVSVDGHTGGSMVTAKMRRGDGAIKNLPARRAGVTLLVTPQVFAETTDRPDVGLLTFKGTTVRLHD